MTDYVQEALDGVDPHPAPPRKRGEPTEKDGIRWARYKVQKPNHCDVCLLQVHADWSKGTTHAPGLAAYRRVENGQTQYLCWIHSVDQRAKDGLAPLKPRRA